MSGSGKVRLTVHVGPDDAGILKAAASLHDSGTLAGLVVEAVREHLDRRGLGALAASVAAARAGK